MTPNFQPPINAYFQTLGDEIAAGLAGLPGAGGSDGGADAALGEPFAGLAADVLRRAGAPAGPIDAVAMADWVVSTPELPRQVNLKSGFGQPPLVVYHHETDPSGGDTVRQSGGSTVGQSGRKATAPLPHCRTARLDGSTETPKHRSTAWLPAPRSLLRAPNCWCRCGLAARYRMKDPLRHTAEVLMVLHRLHPDQFADRLARLLDRADALTALRLMEHLQRGLGLSAFEKAVRPVMEARCGERFPQVIAAMKEGTRSKGLWAMIDASTDPRLQFRLALAELFPTEAALHEQVKASHPGADPKALVAEWETAAAQPGMGLVAASAPAL